MAKSRKRLIIVCSIIGIFIAFGIIFGALFSVRRISVDFASAINRFDTSTAFKNSVIEESGVTKGKSIVFTNFDKVEKTLEKKFPYGKFHIVRNFPNKIIIYIYEREPAFRVQDSKGDWHIYDESLKLLQIVANTNLDDEFLNLPIPPAVSGIDLNLCEKEGEVMKESNFKAKYSSILDGVYGAEESPIHIMSDIVFSNDLDDGTNIVTFTLANSGTKIIVKGDNNFEEKIAKAVYIYLKEIREDNYYSSILDEVEITIYDHASSYMIVLTPTKPTND